jgi:hypothetical protein
MLCLLVLLHVSFDVRSPVHHIVCPFRVDEVSKQLHIYSQTTCMGYKYRANRD